MREVMIIVRREFLERVRTRAFVIGTLAFPILMVAIMVLPNLGDGGGERKLALIDETEARIGDTFVTALELATADRSEDDYSYAIERVPGRLDDARDDLHARIAADELEGYVVIPGDVLDDNSVLYRAETINRRVLRDVMRAASVAVQAQRLREAGMEGQALAELIRPVAVDDARITAAGTEGGDAEEAFWLAYLGAFLIYFMTALYGTAVMRSVIEEKTNRISEVLVSTVRANHLMLGKVLGASSAALLQVAIWIGLAVLLITQSEVVARLLGLSPERLAAVSVPIDALLIFAGFFVFGFFLFAAVFAALGAAMTSEQEAQSMQMVAMIPLFVPLLFIVPITNDPLGGLATFLGLFPLTAPISMPMRIASGQIPGTQVALSLAFLAVALVAVTWLAGKIYRIGILSTGRKPTLRELGRWLREA